MTVKSEKEEQSALLKKLKQNLDKERYTHTLGVAYTGAALAMNYDTDVGKAYIAGLLHDCAKCIPNKEKIALCRKYGLNVTDSEERNPFMLHAKLGSYLAEKEYGINDKEISSAILYHTTGRPDMTLLEKIIFTADYIEPGRDKAKNLKEIRTLSFRDLDAAVEQICRDTLQYLSGMQTEIDPATRETYNYYKKFNEKRKNGEIKWTQGK